MRLLALVLFCCLLPTAVHADYRQLITDGTWWNGLSDLNKAGFVEGYMIGYSAGSGDLQHAIKAVQAIAVSDSTLQSADTDNPEGLTFGSLLRGVDTCYSDVRNTALDVRFCLDWTVRGLKGDSNKDREEYLTTIRSRYRKSVAGTAAHDF